jgi:2-polyprenyl-3-methyl-5-hydroxy-6-metoxy-1,4-benzoquinol methylase
MGMTEAEEAIRRWDRHARRLMANFTSEGDAHRIVLLNPVLFDLLGPVHGKAILDTGCGDGYLSRLLAQRGATVTAVDFSTAMLELAKARTPAHLAITYHQGNCEALAFLEGAQFDVVVSNMVLQDLPDSEAAIAEAYRLVKPGGVYMCSILHPCFWTPESGWERDGAGQKRYWRVDAYFTEGRLEQPFPADTPEPLFRYHRTLTSYMATLLRTGFGVEALVEPCPSPEMLRRYPEFEDGLRMSHFLVFKLRRPV